MKKEKQIAHQHKFSEIALSPTNENDRQMPLCTSYDDLLDTDETAAEAFCRLTSNRPEVAPYNYYFTELMYDLVKQFIKSQENILLVELGCGNGDFLKRIVEDFYPKVDACGYDKSVEMVALAQSRHPEHDFNVFEMVKLLESYAQDKTKLINLIVSINTVHYLPFEQLEKFYQFAYQTLSDNGQLLICTGDDDGTASWRGLSVQDLQNRVNRGERQDKWFLPDEHGRPVFQMAFNIQLISEHVALMKKAGFEVEVIRGAALKDKEWAILLEANPTAYEDLQNNNVFVFFRAMKK